MGSSVILIVEPKLVAAMGLRKITVPQPILYGSSLSEIADH